VVRENFQILELIPRREKATFINAPDVYLMEIICLGL